MNTLARPTTVTLLRVLLVAAMVRVLYALGAWLVTRDPSVFHGPDSESYLAPARELLSRGAFTLGGDPELKRTPGYPLLLLPGLWLGHPNLTVAALQIALSTATVWGVYAVASRALDDSRAAVTAAALYALEPLSVRYAAAVSSETLHTAMVVGALVLALGYLRDGRFAQILAATTLLAAAAYVRPAGYYLPFGLLLLLALLAMIARAWKRLPHVALSALAAGAVLLPWQLRNRALGFDGFSAITALNMYFYNGAAIRAAKEGKSYYEMQAAMGFNDDEAYLRIHPEQRTWRPGERFEHMRAEGARLVRENLPLYTRLHVAGMVRVLLDPAAIDLLKPYRLYPEQGGLLDRIVTHGVWDGLLYLFRTRPFAASWLIGLGIVLGVVYLLALRGLLVQRHFLEPSVILLVACIAYFVVIAGGPVAVSRFRHPAMPMLCVLAAAGIHAPWRRIRRTAAIRGSSGARPIGA